MFADGADIRMIQLMRGNVYGGPHFIHLYRRWLADEHAALTPVSPAIQEAFATGCAATECVVLPHAYDHLSPLAALGAGAALTRAARSLSTGNYRSAN